MDLRGIEMVDFPENGWFSLKSVIKWKVLNNWHWDHIPLPFFPLVVDDLLWFHRSPRNCYVHKIVGWSSGLNGMLPGIQAAMQAPNWYWNSPTVVIFWSTGRWKIPNCFSEINFPGRCLKQWMENRTPPWHGSSFSPTPTAVTARQAIWITCPSRCPGSSWAQRQQHVLGHAKACRPPPAGSGKWIMDFQLG